MKLIDMTCPHCGAHLQINADRKQAFCEYCGTKILIDDEVQHIQYDNAEEAGYKFEKGRQRAQAEARQSQSTDYRAPVQQLPKQKRRTWLWVLGWLLFFPIPVMILIWRKKNTWNIKVKTGATLVFWVLLFAFAGGNNRETAAFETGKIEDVSETKEVEAVQEDNTFVTNTSTAVHTSDEVLLLSEYDKLQKIFLAIDYNTTVDDLEKLIAEYGVEYTAKDYNGTLKSTTYKLAYTSGVALQKYADEGDNLQVRFSKEDGTLLNAEYFNYAAFMNALFYNYGTYWDFREKEAYNKYSGYYYHKPGDTKGGISMEYSNGNSVETGYYSCNSAEEALAHVVPTDVR